MRTRYRGKRRRMKFKRGTLVMLLLLTTVFLVSCMAGSDPLWIREVFGLDVAHYNSESTVAELPSNGEQAEALCDMVTSLCDNSLHLTPFRTASQAVNAYRDALLNDMLRNNYMRYTGSVQTLSSTDAVYSPAVISTLIPAADFEETAHRYFGGTSVRHKNGTVFRYLDGANGYTAPLQAWEVCVSVNVSALAETENTYRMTFTLCDGDAQSTPYTAVFLKRDGGCCLYSLQEIEI